MEKHPSAGKMYSTGWRQAMFLFKWDQRRGGLILHEDTKAEQRNICIEAVPPNLAQMVVSYCSVGQGIVIQ